MIMKCGRPECGNAGIWLLHPTEFNGNRFRCEDHLRGALVDRYGVINGIEYIGPEVADFNALADRLWRKRGLRFRWSKFTLAVSEWWHGYRPWRRQ